MPTQPSWYARVPDMLRCLRAPAAPPFLDRPAMEKLFGVRRRQAIRLMGTCGGYQVGKTFLVGRENLIASLEAIVSTGATHQARQRKQRVSTALGEIANHLAAQRTRIPVEPDLLLHRRGDLPAGIEVVAPGKVHISYDSATGLLAQIAGLVTSAANDFPRFRRIFEPKP